MTSMTSSRWLGSRVAWSAGVVLVVLGGLLLDIVGDPLRATYAFLIGAGTAALGVVLIVAGIEAIWLRRPSSISWRDGVTGIVVGALIAVLSGLALQFLYDDEVAYRLLVEHILPFILVLGAGYFGMRALINRLGV